MNIPIPHKLPHFKLAANTSRPLLAELFEAVQNTSRWDRIAQFEVKKKFNQTGLGPWWTVIMHGIFISVIWLIYSKALNVDPKIYLRHTAFGYLTWIFLSENLSQGSKQFVDNYTLISQLRLNYFGIILKWLIGRIRLFLYTCILIVPILFAGGVSHLGWSILSIIPAIGLILIVSFMMSYIFSVFSAAFRDIPFIIPLILRFFFFATPIIWDPTAVGLYTRILLTYCNPFFIFIELIRSVFVSGEIDLLAWFIALIISSVVTILFVLIYYRYNHRIVYLAS